MSTTVNRQPNWTELKLRIRRHYDVASPLYRNLWGLHIHHGYWQDETKTKEAAQEELVEVLASNAEIGNGRRILDVGCGFGASAKYLSQRFGARVVGINISERQLEVAKLITAECDPRPDLVIADAEYPSFVRVFDVLWSIEALSHVPHKRDCFDRLLELIIPNGRVAIIDWFKAEGLDRQYEQRYIEPIVEHMLLPELSTAGSYARTLQDLGCRILKLQDISPHVAKTWDVCLKFTEIPSVWKFALSHGPDFISFLKGFKAMKDGFASGAFHCSI